MIVVYGQFNVMAKLKLEEQHWKLAKHQNGYFIFKVEGEKSQPKMTGKVLFGRFLKSHSISSGPNFKLLKPGLVSKKFDSGPHTTCCP